MKITQTNLKAFTAHAISKAPQEAVGFLVMQGRKQVFITGRNIADNPIESFAIHPEDYAAAEDAGDIVAILHSHTGPYATAMMSDFDKSSLIMEEVTFGIYSVTSGEYLEHEPVNAGLVGRFFCLGATDCYGLVMAWHKQQGIDLLDFRVPYEWWEKGEAMFTPENFAKAGFVESDLVPGAMVVMQVAAGVPNHCGVMLNETDLIHHLPKSLSNRVNFRGSYFQDRMVYVMRHKDLPQPEDLKPWH
ncbi:MAG: hypothetical protein [Caudoviricetes sp.]|nr:MAG: hypothetical protein [Caudoviricetes sp.]